MSLFRLIEAAEGSIAIDGIDIGGLGLHQLRGALAIIPQVYYPNQAVMVFRTATNKEWIVLSQEPVLFSGSLASNVDPLGLASREALRGALEEAGLGALIKEAPQGRLIAIHELVLLVPP